MLMIGFVLSKLSDLVVSSCFGLNCQDLYLYVQLIYDNRNRDRFLVCTLRLYYLYLSTISVMLV